MRYIAKSDEPPASIREWRVAQEPIGVNLDYNNFTRKTQLRAELIAEQFGLCAYTGTAVDEGLGGYEETDQNLVFQPHIEHIKPRSVCKAELEARGGIYGCELCEDMDHRNLVAALEVKRKPPAKSEVFGAAAHGDEILPVTPVQPDCESRFRYNANGGISSDDEDSIETIRLLKLDHATLSGWRRGAIDGFLPPGDPLTRGELEQLILRLNEPREGRLPEFSFCIRSFAESMLNGDAREIGEL